MAASRLDHAGRERYARPAFSFSPSSAGRQGGASMRWSAAVVVVVLAAGLGPPMTPAADCAAPKAVVATAVGMKYCADPVFDAVITAQVQRIRQDTRAQRQAGKLVVYASTPISPRGGGHVETNLEIAARQEPARKGIRTGRVGARPRPVSDAGRRRQVAGRGGVHGHVE